MKILIKRLAFKHRSFRAKSRNLFNFNFKFEFEFNFPRNPEPAEGSKDASLCYRSVLHDNTKNTNTRTLKTEN